MISLSLSRFTRTLILATIATFVLVFSTLLIVALSPYGSELIEGQKSTHELYARIHRQIPTLHKPCSLQYQVQDCGRELVCIDNICDYCTENSQCSTSSLVCREVSYEDGLVCTHKELFSKFGTTDTWATIIGFFSAMIASSGGIGGGGLFVPAFVLILGFPLGTAIPLSKTAIFGTSVAGYSVNVKKRTKDGRRTLIDYDAALMLEPMVLGGTILGVYLNLISPNWLIIFLVSVVLITAAWRTGKRALNTYRAEKHLRIVDRFTARLEHRARATDSIVLRPGEASDLDSEDEDFVPTSSIDDPALGFGDNSVVNVSSPNVSGQGQSDELGSSGRALDVATTADSGDGDGEDTKKLTLQPADPRQTLVSVLDDEGNASKRVVFMLFCVWLLIVTVAVLRGSRSTPSIIGLHPCHWGYWAIGVFAVPACIIVTLFFGVRQRRKFKDKVRLGHMWESGEIKWSTKHLFFGPLFSFVAGIASGMLGIGGGMLKAPILIELGMEVTMASATSSFMILFTSSATTIQFMILGMLQYDYALWFAALCFVGGLVGKIMITYLTRKHRRTSFILFVVTLVLLDIAQEIGAGRGAGFSNLCPEWSG